MKSYLFLVIAILGEVGATSALKASDGFTKLWPAILGSMPFCVEVDGHILWT